jgi:hypothetical protein
LKRIQKEISVSVVENLPISFKRNGKLYEIVEIEERWILQSKWWEDEEKRIYFRVKTTSGVAEIYLKKTKSNLNGIWMLDTIFD